MTKSAAKVSKEDSRRPPSEPPCGVHELVARSSAWRVRTTNSKVKSNSLTLPTASAIPRVRTYHTKNPSRFVHALPARPLKKRCGREFSLCADESKDFRQPSPVGEGVSHRLTDEVSFKKD